MMPDAQQESMRAWHEGAFAQLHALGTHAAKYLDLDLVIPGDVFPPSPVSDVLGRAVLDEVRAEDRVLDMGTGSGVNAILAARRAHDVTGVDINPHAVAAATANAERHGVADRTRFVHGDLFDPVDGAFDLVIFDPPFRWFRPRDPLELAITDEEYRSLTRFVAELDDHFSPAGRVLLFFGTSGDIAYLHHLIDRSPLSAQTVASRTITANDTEVTYYTYRVTRRSAASQ